MRRRELLALIGAAAIASPLVARAQQQTRLRRIGRLFSGGWAPGPAAFAARLAAHGYVEGRDFVEETRQHQGRLDRVPELAAEIVRLEPDIIIATGPEAVLRALSSATSSIPILMVAVDYDPVALGFVASLARGPTRVNARPGPTSAAHPSAPQRTRSRNSPSSAGPGSS